MMSWGIEHTRLQATERLLDSLGECPGDIRASLSRWHPNSGQLRADCKQLWAKRAAGRRLMRPPAPSVVKCW